MSFEKVKIGDFIFGTIDKIQYDNEHKFKGFGDKADSVGKAVRFVFKFQGYEFPHYSRWMKFSLDERANLYDKYVSKLVANAAPYMDFELDDLVGMEIKTIWEEKNDFQNIAMIMPVGKKKTVKIYRDDEESIPTDDDWIPETE